MGVCYLGTKEKSEGRGHLSKSQNTSSYMAHMHRFPNHFELQSIFMLNSAKMHIRAANSKNENSHYQSMHILKPNSDMLGYNPETTCSFRSIVHITCAVY